MTDPSPQKDDVPVHESLSRIIQITKTSLETISSFGGVSGNELIRNIIDDGNKKDAKICIIMLKF